MIRNVYVDVNTGRFVTQTYAVRHPSTTYKAVALYSRSGQVLRILKTAI